MFCGSSSGVNSIYAEKARELGSCLVKNNLDLVYGGGNIGLMGILANEVLAAGGKVTGVLPHFLNRKEVGHVSLSELILVDSMHERKQKMASLSDGFIAQPGGYGTLEELGEILTWVQLGLVTGPVGLFNVNGFFDNLLLQLDHMVQEGFLKRENRSFLLVDQNPQGLIDQMNSFKPMAVEKWLKTDQT